jgi:predicted lipid-binding transport protein (Tim44 family)
LFILVAVFTGGRRSPDVELDFSFSPKTIEKKAAKTRTLIQRIALNDVDFTPEKLVATARSAFLTLQRCWEARDYAAMAPLVFADLRREHEAQIASMIRNHEIDVIADLHVEKVEVVHLRYTDRKDDRQFTALIQARARDHYVDDRTRRFLRGDREPARFQEFWTFQLHGGKFLLREIEQTRESTALKDENFVEFLTDQQLRDSYGEALAAQRGEAGPWVEGEGEARGTKVHRMLNFLVETDKVWNEKAMQDAARTATIALYAALEAGDVAGLRDLAHPEEVAAVQARIDRDRASGRRVEYRNLCVRKVEIALVLNRANNERDEYLARVACHAQRVSVGGGGPSDPDVRRFTSFLKFRRAGDRFKLAAVLPPGEGDRTAAEENVDEESTQDQLQWYYTKERTIS